MGTWLITVTLAGNNLILSDEHDILLTLAAGRGPALLAALSQIFMDREAGATWSTIGNTLHLGPTGGPWIAGEGDRESAERIATAHNTIVEAFRAAAVHLEARNRIMAAQLAGWEAQCAAQVEAAQVLIDHIEVNHPVCLIADPELAGQFDRLKETITTDAGRLVLMKLRELEQQIGGVVRAEASAAALRQALLYIRQGAERAGANWWHAAATAALDSTDAGAALLAELEAARAAIAASRLAGVDGLCEPEEARDWLAKMAAYDEAVKARPKE